ncbi:uncharacterized protein EMH_0020240 [Eimeria mitis]|uniref:Uncharacterized protein n=1 Tax=Eimeria mitis TaxID=44415 RepID=U6K0L9_9EIME|nr:uncharacterized protein EMH_0020240 [Eimeria mitis]CDJ29308.1 hypothetical protein, conserved [Eimeria mitis]
MRSGSSRFVRVFGAATAAAAAAALLLLCPYTVVHAAPPSSDAAAASHDGGPQAPQGDPNAPQTEPQEELMTANQLDAILEGIEIFRPRMKPLSHGKEYDAAVPLEDRGQEVCMRLRERSGDCPSAAAAAAVAALSCNMVEVSAAKETAVQLEEALMLYTSLNAVRHTHHHLLEDAVHIAQRSYERGLSYFNELMNQQPRRDGKSLYIPLQKNTAPEVNLRRICFSLNKHPSPSVLEAPDPCTLHDLLLPTQQQQQQQQQQQEGEYQQQQEEQQHPQQEHHPQQEQQQQQQEHAAEAQHPAAHAGGEQEETASSGDTPQPPAAKEENNIIHETSLLQAAEEPIARPEPAATNVYVVDTQKLHFYFHLVAATGMRVCLHACSGDREVHSPPNDPTV